MEDDQGTNEPAAALARQLALAVETTFSRAQLARRRSLKLIASQLEERDPLPE